MKVNKVSLQVLAPYCYYDDCNLSWLGQGLDKGVRSLAETITGGAITMDFSFLAIPKEFTLPFKTGQAVSAIENLQPDDELVQTVSAVPTCGFIENFGYGWQLSLKPGEWASGL